MKIKLLIVDDHLMVRNGLKLMINQQAIFVPNITEAKTSAEAIEMINKIDYDVILLDISLPDKNGIETTKTILKLKPASKILIVTMHEEDFIINQVIKAGAFGYILKDISLDELAKAIVTVSKSKTYFCNEVSQILLGKISNQQSKINKPNLKEALGIGVLSTREKEIMHYIAKEYKSVQIAEKLFISKRTVDGHRKNIMVKLHLKSTAGIVKYAVENGL